MRRRGGVERFAIVGHERILTVMLIMEPIEQGRVSIDFGRGEPSELRAAAEETLRVLVEPDLESDWSLESMRRE